MSNWREKLGFTKPQAVDFIGVEFHDNNYPDAVCRITGIFQGFYVVSRQFPGGPTFTVFMSAKEIIKAQATEEQYREYLQQERQAKEQEAVLDVWFDLNPLD